MNGDMSNGSIVIGGKASRPVLCGPNEPLFIVCGPCVIESRDHLLDEAEKIVTICRRVGLPLVFKSSYDKANRTSLAGFRGIGIEPGLRILSEVRDVFQVPVVTDVHTPEEASLAAQFVDMLQVPAFLCRQTDLLQSVARQGLPVLVKKGQFLHPEDMKYVAQKIADCGSNATIACERGTCFGYRDLVVDYRSLEILKGLGLPTVFDATHSVQVMGGAHGASSGNRKFVPPLARAAVAVGVQGIFLEAHSNPDAAPSDGPNMIPIDELEALLADLKELSTLRLNTRSYAR